MVYIWYATTLLTNLDGSMYAGQEAIEFVE